MTSLRTGSFCMLCALSVVTSACAGSLHRKKPQLSAAAQGDTKGLPSLTVLPEAVKGVPSNSERMHRGLTMAGEIFSAVLPSAPSDRSYDNLQGWVDSEIVPWIEKRRDGVEATRFEFGLNTESLPADAVVARTVLGLLQEDTALSLLRIPQPLELDTEPAVAEIFRGLIHTQTEPFVGAALEEYGACSQLGDQVGNDLERWADFCRARASRLRASNAPDHPK